MTTENKNELAVQEVEENTSVTVRENDEFVVLKQNGKFVRKAKFKSYSSIVPQTKEEKIWLLNVMEGDEDTGNGLKSHVGKQIVVADVITNTYDRINEETGQQEYGVLTYLITPEKQVFVTSSKSVYFSIMKIMDYFGRPDEERWENVTVKVGKEKGTNGDMIKIKMIG